MVVIWFGVTRTGREVVTIPDTEMGSAQEKKLLVCHRERKGEIWIESKTFLRI